MLTDASIARLWGKLSDEFNVHVRSIGVGKLDNGDECTVVTVDDRTDPAVIQTLPGQFENEKVKYETGAAARASKGGNPPCGQPGHQCGCPAPKKP